MYSTSWFLESPVGYQLGRINIARIAIRILVELGWFSWTFLAAYMVTGSALLGTLDKSCLAYMTSASNPLNNILANEVLAARTGGNRKWNGWISRILEVRCQRDGATLTRTNFANLGLGNQFALGLSLLFRGWEARALLAARVLAVDADLLGTEGRFTAVTSSTNSHANRLGHSGQFDIAGGSLPFAGF